MESSNVLIFLSQDGPLYILRDQRLTFPKRILFLFLKIIYSADPDEMLQNVAFHQGLQ